MAENGDKKIKSLAKMAKERLKNGFWEDYRENVQKQVDILKEEGENTSDVIRFYKEKATREISNSKQGDEEFYLKVKNILDEYGDVSDMIARLCDENYLATLSFVQKEKYIFEIATKYRECKDRYIKEKKYSFENQEKISDNIKAV